MTSEAPHRPGQEPGEVSPGAGGPAPYGDRPAPQDNGYSGAPDLGWAPPPPAGQPAQPTPAWTPDDQPPAWAPPGGQPVTNRGSAQVPAPAEPGAWGGSPQAAWAPPGESTPPSWGNPAEHNAPAWPAPASHGEPPAWGQQGEPGSRGTAQVPAPATVPYETWAAPAAPQQEDANRSGGWAVGAGAQQDDPNRSGGWNTARQDEEPAWGQQGDQSAPAWAAPAEPAARAAAKAPVPGQGDNHWSAPDDPARSGGWAAGTRQDDPARSGGWEAEPAGPRDGDPDRSGGWAAGRAADSPQQPAWGASDEQRPAWGDAAAAPQRDQDDPAQPGWGAAAPTSGDRPEAGAWAPAESPARASASVPSPDSPPTWGGNQDEPAQWTPPQRPTIPEAEPWAPGEAWGRAAEAEPAESASNGWEPNRAEDAPVYQPAPGPGISAANAVPLPPQEQRVPGAALAAASPPSDYMPSGPFGPAAESAEHGPQGHEPERADWGTPEPAHEEPQSPAGPVVPAPRTSPESGTVSASASVPVASRVTPPTDQQLHGAGVPAPQPRVYGRSTRSEAGDGAGPDAPNGYPEQGTRFDEHGPQSRMEEPERANAFAEVPPPSSPAGPPPFPPGVPSFVDPAGNNRPVNGVHPQSAEHPGDPFGAPGDPFGGPGVQRDPFDGPGPFGGPGGQHDQFGGPGGQHDQFAGPGGQHDQFAGPGGQPDQFAGPGGQHDQFGAPAGGRAAVAVPGQGQGAPGGFPPAFPPPPQQAPPAWQQGPTGDSEQGRFDAFKPEAETQTEAPAPKVRNGKVLALVLIAAVLILAVPLGALALLGKLGGDHEKAAPFDPAVGSCIKQSGTTAAAANCGEQGAFTVVSKVDSKDKCADPTQPTVSLKGVEGNRVLCLKPAGS